MRWLLNWSGGDKVFLPALSGVARIFISDGAKIGIFSVSSK